MSHEESADTDRQRREHRRAQTADIPPGALDALIDDGSGTAALTRTEDWVRNNAREPAHDGRGETRTYFDPRGVSGRYPNWQLDRDPDERRSWATLAQWQDGVQSDISRGGQNWWADKQRWVDTFGERLGATEYHKDEAKRVLEVLSEEPDSGDEEREMMTYSSRRVPVEVVIIGILSLYIDADITDFDNRTLARDGTTELLADLDASISDYETTRSVLRQEHSHILFPAQHEPTGGSE